VWTFSPGWGIFAPFICAPDICTFTFAPRHMCTNNYAPIFASRHLRSIIEHRHLCPDICTLIIALRLVKYHSKKIENLKKGKGLTSRVLNYRAQMSKRKNRVPKNRVSKSRVRKCRCAYANAQNSSTHYVQNLSFNLCIYLIV
jgi:hypothetical protein